MNAQKWLVGYSAALTGAVCIALITGAAPVLPVRTSFEEIDVQRINIVEADGTLRMTLSGRDRLPGVIIRGTEYDFERDLAGLLFYNDEGSETGGLVFGGREEDGRPVSTGSLTFDRYEQDQVVQILETENGSRRFAGLLVSDRPDGQLDFDAITQAIALPDPAERAQVFRDANAGEAHRAMLARDADGNAQLSLNDANGRPRLVLRVTEAGEASIEFLDEDGNITRTVLPE